MPVVPRSRKEFFDHLEHYARALPWHEFVLEYVRWTTTRQEDRALVRDYQVKRVGDRWTWGVAGRHGYVADFPPADASTAYGYLERLPLQYFAREADNWRTEILTRRNPARARGGRARRRAR